MSTTSTGICFLVVGKFSFFFFLFSFFFFLFSFFFFLFSFFFFLFSFFFFLFSFFFFLFYIFMKNSITLKRPMAPANSGQRSLASPTNAHLRRAHALKLAEQVSAQRKRVSEAIGAKDAGANIRNILLGCDFTASTSEVIDKFKELISSISSGIRSELPDATQHFGVMRGGRQTMGKDIDVFDTYNSAGDSNTPLLLQQFIRASLDTDNKREGAIAVVVADELDYSHGSSYQDKSVLHEIQAAFRNSPASQLFFIYGETQNHDNDRIIEKLIDPLGKQGHFLDFSQTNASQVLKAVLACVQYTKIAAKTSHSVGTAPPVDLQKLLEQQGVAIQAIAGKGTPRLGFSG